MTLDECYGLNFSVKSFAVANAFVSQLNKVCYALGKNLQTFTLLGGDQENKYGVLDLAQFEGLVDQSKTLFDEIVDYRLEVYKKSNMFFQPNDLIKKTLFFDYLMTISMCYIEIPKYHTKEGVSQKTYDKFLVTRNPNVMAIWLGATSNEMQVKYSTRISSNTFELSQGEIRAVKLSSSGKGNSIIAARTPFKVESMTCIPLFMSYAFMKGLENDLRNGLLRFSFLKDNNTIRVLDTTLSSDILMDYYHDRIFVEHILRGTDIFESAVAGSAGISLGTKQHRGYVHVPEVGSSRYDATCCRSLNFARILKVERIAEADRSFIDVDLSSVVSSCNECIDYIVEKTPDQLRLVYKAVTGEDYNNNQESSGVVSCAVDLQRWIHTREVILSTTFQRSLHKFMIGNPQWFPFYTGKPNNKVVNSQNFGVDVLDGWA